jgi:hypothetical protein
MRQFSTVLTSFAFFVLALGLACSSDDSASTMPSDTSSSVPGTSTPLPATTSLATQTAAEIASSFREFARSLNGPLSRQDSSFFRSRIQTKHVVCMAQEFHRLGPGIGCQRAGQEFDGIQLSYYSSDIGGAAPVNTAIALIERLWSEAVPGATDQFGDSSARAFALSFPDLSLPAEAPRKYVVVFTAIHDQVVGSGGQTALRRASLVTYWEMLDGQWRLTALLDAFGLGQDFVEPSQDVRRFLGSWERLSP